MDNIKVIIKDNLISLRKANKLTQLELSQKIGYSDKAISRWETGETTPDVETLNSLALLYDVPISYFFEESHEAVDVDKKAKEKLRANKLAISLLCIVSVWFVAIILFDVLNKIVGARSWMAFIWVIPVSFLLAMIFSSVWGRREWTYIFASMFSWTFILAVYLQFITFFTYIIFVAGVPIQVVIILAYFLKKSRKSKEKKEDKKNISEKNAKE